MRIGDRVELVDVSTVKYFYAQETLTIAVTHDRKHAIDLRMADLERRLPPRHWVRIHRATPVRVDAVKELHSWFGGRLLLRLEDGTQLQVARDRARDVRAVLGV